MILQRTAMAIVVAVVFLGTAAAVTYAQSLGLIGPEAAKRTIQVMSGLILAAYGNLMPKDVGRWPASPLAVARAQTALRVGGWSMTLAGLLYAVLWAVAPLAVAKTGGVAVVATGILITVGYGGWRLLACRSKHTAA